MTIDRSFGERNRAATDRMRALAERLSDEELQHPVGEHWTVGIALAHLAFWDQRVLYALNLCEHDEQLVIPQIDLVVNDMSLPFWAAIPPREAGRLAIEIAETLDQRLLHLSADLLEKVYAYNERWIVRAIHRNSHLDEIEAALNSRA